MYKAKNIYIYSFIKQKIIYMISKQTYIVTDLHMDLTETIKDRNQYYTILLIH